MKPLSEKEWGQFFELVGRIVNDERPQHEKEEELKDQVDKRHEATTLGELFSWDVE